MTDPSEIIYKFLLNRNSPVTNMEIALAIGVKSDRDIQANGEDEGILERARKHIWKQHQTFLVTNFSGSILTKDVNKAREYVAQVFARSIHTINSAKNYEARFKEAENKQVELFSNEKR